MAESDAWNDYVSFTPELTQINQSSFGNQYFDLSSNATSMQNPKQRQNSIINDQISRTDDHNNNSSSSSSSNDNKRKCDGDNERDVPISQMCKSSNRPQKPQHHHRPHHQSRIVPSPFDPSFDGPLQSKFHYQQSGQGIWHPLHASSDSNGLVPWEESAGQYFAIHTGDSSRLTAMGNIGSNDKINQVAESDSISNTILLNSEDKPFSRVDDDGSEKNLLHVFDDDIESTLIKRVQMPRPEPLSPESNKEVQVRHFTALRQQEQEEEALMQKIWRVDEALSASSSISQNPKADDTLDSHFSVPSTMMPPTVLASTLPSNKRKSVKAISSKQNKKCRKISSEYSPQSRFEELIQQLGILGVERIKADAAEYAAVPSPLQLASFGTRFVKAIHTSDEKALSELLRCGLSPNPCNQFRDSMLDLVCKQGNAVIFDCFMRHGADLQTMDGFGRTPLHHCCWASTFCRPIVDAIIERDPMQLMIEDKRGQTPLEYVRADLASEWIQYLEANVKRFWGDKAATLSSPKANRPSGTLVDPLNAMPVNLATMVSSGKLLPVQVMPMLRTRKRSQSSDIL